MRCGAATLAQALQVTEDRVAALTPEQQQQYVQAYRQQLLIQLQAQAAQGAAVQ